MSGLTPNERGSLVAELEDLERLLVQEIESRLFGDARLALEVLNTASLRDRDLRIELRVAVEELREQVKSIRAEADAAHPERDAYADGLAEGADIIQAVLDDRETTR